MEEKKEWYVVNTYAGHENRVRENLLRRVETMGLQDHLFQILVAEETNVDYVDNKKGKGKKKTEKARNLFPGYLFVEMIMTDEAWYIVRNTPGVTGFIGSSGGGAKPFPVSQEEIENIFLRLGLMKKQLIIDFNVGDKVRIENGPFANHEGVVETMNHEAESAMVLIILFGRLTPTEIAYADLKKVEY